MKKNTMTKEQTDRTIDALMGDIGYFWRQVEKKWEEACKKGGLYVFEEYELE